MKHCECLLKEYLVQLSPCVWDELHFFSPCGFGPIGHEGIPYTDSHSRPFLVSAYYDH